MSKVFYTKFSELSGNRFDASYYIPELVELEKQVTKISTKKLKDFVVSISSGATPKKSANNDYYEEDKSKGIPFLRVQNLTTFGKLDFKGLKYITPETHHKMLKRSQVAEDDLLIKITGVGRMAIASVPDKGFIGNTNQHMVVIKTKSREVSETLATYLNLDIAEKLASRRATGGTRPALDYPALLSIPVIYDDKIVQKVNDAYKRKEAKEKEAKEKLKSIDDYLLEALGIEFPKKRNESVADRVFFRKFSELSGDRMDPLFYKNKFKKLLTNISKNNHKALKSIVSFSSETWNQKDIFSDTFPYIEISEIDIVTGDIKKINYINVSQAPSRAKMIIRDNDIIISTTRPDRGAISFIHTDSILIASTGFSVIRNVSDEIKKEFLFILLKSSIVLKQFSQRSSGGNYPAITQEEISKVIIPIPDVQIQNKIVKHIRILKEEAKSLKEEASKIYNDAKVEVEKMILGEEL